MEASKTDLKRRSSEIFNEQLRVVDPFLYQHLVSQGLEPELILIKMLKCLVSREFEMCALFPAWDYMLCGFRTELYVAQEDILRASFDQLANLNHLCLALICHSRNRYIEGDYVECLQIAMKPLEL